MQRDEAYYKRLRPLERQLQRLTDDHRWGRSRGHKVPTTMGIGCFDVYLRAWLPDYGMVMIICHNDKGSSSFVPVLKALSGIAKLKKDAKIEMRPYNYDEVIHWRSPKCMVPVNAEDHQMFVLKWMVRVAKVLSNASDDREAVR